MKHTLAVRAALLPAPPHAADVPDTVARPKPAIGLAAPGTEAQRDKPLYNLVIYGDSSGAVVATVAARREGRSVILVNWCSSAMPVVQSSA
jgi:hypothetical protein